MGAGQRGLKECALHLRWEGPIEVLHESFYDSTFKVCNTSTE